MAVPTISTITPSSGLTRGRNIVLIAGTNFRLPPTPGVGDHSGEPAQQTVGVTFDGVASPEAHAVTASLAHVEVPAWAGDVDETGDVVVAVQLSNLDDAGVVIPGETASGSYTYTRARLFTRATTYRVTVALIEHLRRHVLPSSSKSPRVFASVARDYPDEPGASSPDRVAQAERPAIHVIGPSLVDAPEWGRRHEQEEDDPGDAEQYIRTQVQIPYHLEYTIDCYADETRGQVAAHALAHNVRMMVRDLPSLTVSTNADDPTADTVTYPLQMVTPASFETDPDLDGRHRARSGVRVLGVLVDDVEATTLERGWRLLDQDYPVTVTSEGFDV